MDREEAIANIGKKVCKKSGKPFKSHLWVNTVKGIGTMTVLSKGKLVERLCYTFEEDDSMVSAEICEVKG
jgi:hypothetical protein